jgi:hypothetical protein
MLYLEQRQYARISQNWVVVMLIWLVERSFGLISTDLWGGQSDLHFKGVFISPFLSFDWSIWKYCRVVGLTCNLREFYGVVRLICTLREFLSVHFFHFDWSIWNYWQFLLVSNFLDWFGLIRGWGYQSLKIAKFMRIAKQSFIFPYMKVFHSWENYFTMSSIYMYAADFTTRFDGL